MTYLATVRQRGQITIPDKIRNDLPWLTQGSAIHIVSIDKNTLIVKPYEKNSAKIHDWKKIWDLIALSRSFTGKKGNLSSFVIKDRESH